MTNANCNLDHSFKSAFKFRGTARVNWAQISFPNSDEGHVDCCDTWQVSALVDERMLHLSLQKAGLQQETLFETPDSDEYPKLLFPSDYTLTGLGMREKQLCGGVGLYHDSSCLVRLFVIDNFMDEKSATDGDIFRIWRLSLIHGQFQEHETWYKYLRKSLQRDVKTLARNSRIMTEIDLLLKIPGLWTPVKLGAIRRLTAVNCDEEIVSYLRHIRRTWDSILSDCEDAWSVDDATIEFLQLRAPATCLSDHKEIIVAMSTGQLFPHIADHQKRTNILARILKVSWLIPTIQTLFSNMMYLEPCAKVLKELMSPNSKLSTRQAFEKAFDTTSCCYVEIAEGELREVVPSTESFNFRSSYIQLWLFAARHFPEMAAMGAKKEKGMPTPAAKQPNEWLRYEFALLAKKLGFETNVSRRILLANPDLTLARRTLMDARPQEIYFYDEDRLEVYIREMADMFSSARKRQLPLSDSKVGSYHPVETRERRSGRPHETSHVTDRHYLFLPQLTDKQDTTKVTSLLVKWDFFSAFFESCFSDTIQYSGESDYINNSTKTAEMQLENRGVALAPHNRHTAKTSFNRVAMRTNFTKNPLLRRQSYKIDPRIRADWSLIANKSLKSYNHASQRFLEQPKSKRTSPAETLTFLRRIGKARARRQANNM